MNSSRKTTPPQSNDDVNQHRTIRSYVLRSGRMTPAQRRALTELWPAYGLEPATGLFDWIRIFGRDAPCALEIGFGNGENLISMAIENPETNFVGIEVHEPGVGHCLLQAEQHNLTNLKLVRCDAVAVLRDNVPDASLSRLNLFFPDPWHKKRHHKRRIVQPGFVDLVARKLTTGGILHIVTDWPNYAEHIDAVVSANPSFEPMPAVPSDRLVTRFDNRGARLGHSNWERAWCKCSKVNTQPK